jgi:hypothetical protein
MEMQRWGLAVSVGPNRLVFTSRRGYNPVYETSCLEKVRVVDNFQESRYFKKPGASAQLGSNVFSLKIVIL